MYHLAWGKHLVLVRMVLQQFHLKYTYNKWCNKEIIEHLSTI